MSISSSNHPHPVRQTPASTQGITPYSSAPHTSKVDQEEFERALDEPSEVEKKSGWSEANQQQLSLSMFQRAHAQSMHHTTEMKKIYDGLSDSGKSKSNRRHS